MRNYIFNYVNSEKIEVNWYEYTYSIIITMSETGINIAKKMSDTLDKTKEKALKAIAKANEKALKDVVKAKEKEEKAVVKAKEKEEKAAVKAKEKEENANKLTNNQLAVNQLFKPSEDGISEWVEVVDIEKSSLNWSSNGNQRHGIYFSDKRFIWEQEPKNGSKIKKLRTTGLSDGYLYGASRPIRQDIHKFYKENGRCIVCGSNSDLVTDHKNDLYNDPRVLDSKTQTKDDFQCLCNHCNLQKSAVEQKTRASGKRYGATNIPMLTGYGIDFISGDETYDKNDINAMVGTFWYDPVEFMEKIKM